MRACVFQAEKGATGARTNVQHRANFKEIDHGDHECEGEIVLSLRFEVLLVILAAGFMVVCALDGDFVGYSSAQRVTPIRLIVNARRSTPSCSHADTAILPLPADGRRPPSLIPARILGWDR